MIPDSLHIAIADTAHAVYASPEQHWVFGIMAVLAGLLGLFLIYKTEVFMSIILTLIVIIALLLWLVVDNQTARMVLKIALAFFLAVWFLQAIGFIGQFDIHFGKVI